MKTQGDEKKVCQFTGLCGRRELSGICATRGSPLVFQIKLILPYIKHRNYQDEKLI